MTTRNTNENFNIIVSTKKTVLGASATDWKVYYAPVTDLTNKSVVDGGMTEAVESITDAHTATVTQPAAYGSRLIYVDGANSTLEEGESIEYATGLYGYIQKIVGDKIYLKRGIKASLAVDDTLTQVGNSGDYTSGTISIPNEGEYLITVEAPDYGIMVGERVKVLGDTTATVDSDAPEDTVAVAY